MKSSITQPDSIFMNGKSWYQIQFDADELRNALMNGELGAFVASVVGDLLPVEQVVMVVREAISKRKSCEFPHLGIIANSEGKMTSLWADEVAI